MDFISKTSTINFHCKHDMISHGNKSIVVDFGSGAPSQFSKTLFRQVKVGLLEIID